MAAPLDGAMVEDMPDDMPIAPACEAPADAEEAKLASAFGGAAPLALLSVWADAGRTTSRATPAIGAAIAAIFFGRRISNSLWEWLFIWYDYSPPTNSAVWQNMASAPQTDVRCPKDERG